MKKILITIILFFFTTSLNANDREAELNQLFVELKKDIPSLSFKIEQQIWLLWSTHPTDQRLTSMLDEGSRLVQDQKLNRAITVFTEAIELDPLWAEAWNKRATVFYMVGELQKSQNDIDKIEKDNNKLILTTEKDFQKIQLLNRKNKWVYLEIKIEFLQDESLFNSIVKKAIIS